MMHHIDIFPEHLKEEIKQMGKKQLGEEPFIHPTCKIKDSKIGSWTALGANTSISESTFGDYSYTAGEVSMVWTDVGKFCSIANGTRINPGNHPQWRVTQHHSTYRRRSYGFDEVDDTAFFQWRKDHNCVIGHDVWIGTRAIVMAGVKIGTGAVIGAGAVVTKDIGDYEVAVGVPARPIKKRFPDDVIKKLLQSQWWDWDRKTLEARFKDLMDLDLFLEKYC
jgi:phosphonate metabolism protein (transferase hexapeptide repeat family)